MDIGNTMQCVQFDSAGAVVSDPSCSAGFVIQTSAEVSGVQVDPGRISDMTALFYAFLAVFVVVWGVKQLLNLFSGDTSRD